MKKLNHINVIRIYEVIENPDNDKLYMGNQILSVRLTNFKLISLNYF